MFQYLSFTVTDPTWGKKQYFTLSVLQNDCSIFSLSSLSETDFSIDSCSTLIIVYGREQSVDATVFYDVFAALKATQLKRSFLTVARQFLDAFERSCIALEWEATEVV